MTLIGKMYLAAVSILFVQLVNAQQSKPVADSAPVPPAMAAAKKVFISNAGADDFSGEAFSGGQARCYNDLYRQIQALNQYDLVSSPADADIVLEINMTLSGHDIHAMGDKDITTVVRLRVLDPKTHFALWAFYEHPKRANLKSTFGKNLDMAVKQLVSDLKTVIGIPNPATP